MNALRYLSIGLPVVLLLRLVQQKLWLKRPYSALAWYLAAGFCRDMILTTSDQESHTYAVLWEATLPGLLLTQAAAGWATYRAMAELYPKIGRFAVRLFGVCLAVTFVAGLLFLPLEITRIGAEEANLRVLFLVQRWVASLLAGGLVLAVLFLWRYPRPLKQMPRNIFLHTTCIAVYFASYAALYAIENLHALGGAEWAERGQLVLVVIVYTAWLGLSAQGQKQESWPGMDADVVRMIQEKEERARELLRQAARK